MIFICLSNPVFGSEQVLSAGYQGLQKIHANSLLPKKSLGNDN